LHDSVAEALHVWLEIDGEPDPDALMFQDHGMPLNVDHMTGRIRADLEKAKVTRARLFEREENTLPFGTHSFRHSFTTRNLANGKPDDWVRQRTGRTTDQLLVYRESAKAIEELDLSELTPLVDAIPELQAVRSNESGWATGWATNSRGGQIRTADPLTPSQVR
jgi:integrase